MHVGFAFMDGLSYTAEARDVLSEPVAREVLNAFVDEVESIEAPDVEQANSTLSDLRRALKEQAGLEAREVMFSVRAGLTGSLHGPSLAVVVALLGRERCIQRARDSRDSFS
jgi:nondiscriminating glutamyl-tRNA synthetase